MRRILWGLLALLALSGCMGADEPVPLSTIERLTGDWVQTDGPATLRFYQDATVKFHMPQMQPPLKVLSELEVIKDDDIGFSIGDRWLGPVHIRFQRDADQLLLLFPPDDPKGEPTEMHFRRASGQ